MTLGMLVRAFNASTYDSEAGIFLQFKANLLHMLNCRPARAIYKESLKKKKKLRLDHK